MHYGPLRVNFYTTFFFNKTFSKVVSSRHSTTRFSENVVMAETSYQMLEVLLFAIERGLNLLQ